MLQRLKTLCGADFKVQGLAMEGAAAALLALYPEALCNREHELHAFVYSLCQRLASCQTGARELWLILRRKSALSRRTIEEESMERSATPVSAGSVGPALPSVSLPMLDLLADVTQAQSKGKHLPFMVRVLIRDRDSDGNNT